DDFWMATTRFMRELEIPLVEGENSAAVDLFDLRHARRVLAAFGRAFGALPEGALLPEQQRFVDQAIGQLARAGNRPLPIRLTPKVTNRLCSRSPPNPLQLGLRGVEHRRLWRAGDGPVHPNDRRRPGLGAEPGDLHGSCGQPGLEREGRATA